jgi:hypothetical protein
MNAFCREGRDRLTQVLVLKSIREAKRGLDDPIAG